MAESSVILAHGDWKNNAEVIRDALVPLGHLRSEWITLDPMYHDGKFWRLWEPMVLVKSDIDPEFSPDFPDGLDARNLPYTERCIDVVMLDPPYKLNGTPDSGGAANADKNYGVHVPATIAERHELIYECIAEAGRVLKKDGRLILKCMNQVSSGKKHFQTILFANHAATLGFRLVDQLDMPSYRAQPEGRSQKHARTNTSTFLIFKLERPNANTSATP